MAKWDVNSTIEDMRVTVTRMDELRTRGDKITEQELAELKVLIKLYETQREYLMNQKEFIDDEMRKDSKGNA